MEQQENTRRRPRSAFKRNDRANAIAVCLLALAFVLVLTLITVLSPAKTYSESENRMLARKPALTGSSLTDGSYFSGSESAFADQFPGRDGWISTKLTFDRIFGAKESSGVYLGKDGYLLQQPSAPNEAALAANLEAINAFAAAHKDVAMYMTLAPNAVTVLADKLPANAPVPDQPAQLAEIQSRLSGVKFLDVTQGLLAHSSEELYYHTDHHWTSLGARYAFEAMAPELGIRPATEYNIYTVSDSFEGTLSARSGSHGWLDQVKLYVPQPEVDYKVVYADTNAITATLYDKSALESKDHYTVFFGGNHPRIDITTTVENQRRLLIFKDSYSAPISAFVGSSWAKSSSGMPLRLAL